MLEQIIQNGDRFSSNKRTKSDSIQFSILDELKKLKSQNITLSKEKSQLEEEFESLSQALFEEANKMVAEARKSQFDFQSYNTSLIEENKSLKSIIKSLQADQSNRASLSLPMTIPPPPKAPQISSTTSSIQTRSSLKCLEDDVEDDLQQSAPIVRPSLDKTPASPPKPSQTPSVTRLNQVRQSWFSKFRKPTKQQDDPFDLNEGYGALMSLNVDDDDDDDDNNDQEVLIDNNDDNNDNNNSHKSESLTKSPSFPTLGTSSKLSTGRTSSFPSIPQLKTFN